MSKKSETHEPPTVLRMVIAVAVYEVLEQGEYTRLGLPLTSGKIEFDFGPQHMEDLRELFADAPMALGAMVGSALDQSAVALDQRVM